MTEDIKAYEIRVYGRVQRVGFRRYVLDYAQEYGLKGFVENLKDGSVYIFVQGDKKILEKFLEVVKTAPEPVKIRDLKNCRVYT